MNLPGEMDFSERKSVVREASLPAAELNDLLETADQTVGCRVCGRIWWGEDWPVDEDGNFDAKRGHDEDCPLYMNGPAHNENGELF